MPFRYPILIFFVLSICLSVSSCVKWFSGDVATGIARLSVRSLGAVTKLLNNDSLCGFSSDSVESQPVIEGEIGGRGVVTYQVQNCKISLNEDHVYDTDCFGTQSLARGTITVNAKKVMRGRITGDPETPIVPEDRTAVDIHLEKISFDNFKVSATNDDNHLTIKKGTLSAIVIPTLAVDESNGICAFQTLNTQFLNVRYGPSQVKVKTQDRSFEAKVNTSNFAAINGTVNDKINHLQGTLTVWDQKIGVPNDNDGLNPNFDAVEFLASYLCLPDLKFPISYDCDPTPQFANAIARLTVNTLATLAALSNDDTQCGFSSDLVINSVMTAGLVGEPNGQVTYPMRRCTLHYPAPTLVDTDCFQVKNYVQGQATISGTKTILGYLTGDPDEPVVPMNNQPVQIEIQADLQDWAVTDSESDTYLQILSGTLAGIVEPQTGLDRDSMACSISLPTAILSNISLKNVEARIVSGAKIFDAFIAFADLNAVNGHIDEWENYLAGTLRIDEKDVIIPTDAEGLDPDYDAQVFLKSYNCDSNLIIPQNKGQCTFQNRLGQGAARLLMQALGTIAGQLDNDDNCGFSAIDNLLPENLTGDPFNEVTATWKIENCRLRYTKKTLVDQNCLGTKTYVQGSLTGSAQKIVTGKIDLGYPPILPQSRDSVILVFDEIQLDNFRAVEHLAQSTEAEPYLEFTSGTLSAIMQPITGEAIDKPGSYFVSTPVSAFKEVRLENAVVTLHLGEKRFSFVINDTLLDAFNGSYQDQFNYLRGKLQLNGDEFNIPVELEEPSLNPDYDQNEFDASYICTENLKETIPPG